MPHDGKHAAAFAKAREKDNHSAETYIKEEWERKTSDLMKRELDILNSLSEHDRLVITGALEVIETKKSTLLTGLFKYAASVAEDEIIKLYGINSYSFESHGTSWKLVSWHQKLQRKLKRGIGSQLTGIFRDWLDKTRANKALIK